MPLGTIKYDKPTTVLTVNEYQLAYYHANKNLISLQRKQRYQEKKAQASLKQTQ